MFACVADLANVATMPIGLICAQLPRPRTRATSWTVSASLSWM
jgi:hypothetical protein